jgi:hypothetical protein
VVEPATCDFRDHGGRCGAVPVVNVVGRGPLCDEHREFVEDERQDRAERAALRRQHLEALDRLNEHPRGRDSRR